MFKRILIALVPSLLATAAIAAPSASAASRVSVSLNETTGVLSITGTEDDSDYAEVRKDPDAGYPGGYVLKIYAKGLVIPDLSANCTEQRVGQTSWLITCPALNAKSITYDGGGQGDSFVNNTSLPSTAHGGPGTDYFKGGSGPDVFYGNGEDDNLIGNDGDDTLDGGAGIDTISGGAGTDIASWADAPSSVSASLDGVANDGTSGENENIPSDVEGIQGSWYDDKLSGTGLSNDTLLGGGGADDLHGWGGDDTLRGEAGDDTLQSTATVLDGGPGFDTLSYAGYGQPVYVYQDGAANDGSSGEQNVTSIENLTGTSYNDDLQGTSGDDVIHGNKGADKIESFAGDDALYGGDGADTLIPGPGRNCGNAGCSEFDTDTVNGGADEDAVDYSQRSDDLTIALDGSQKSGGYLENDTLTAIEDANGGDGNDTIYGNAASNSLIGRGGNDGIDGEGGNDYVSGEAGNDKLFGGPGNDWVTGGAGADTLSAPGGDDTLYGGPGKDLVSYWGDTAGVTATIGAGTSGQAGEADKIQSDVEDLEGSTYDDKLYGSAAANHITGLAGKDTIVGNGGADLLEGNEGADILKSNGDAIQDKSMCGAGGDTAYADNIDTVTPDCETVHRG